MTEFEGKTIEYTVGHENLMVFYFTDGTRIILRAYHEYQNDIRFAICPEEDLDNFEKKMLLK